MTALRQAATVVSMSMPILGPGNGIAADHLKRMAAELHNHRVPCRLLDARGQIVGSCGFPAFVKGAGGIELMAVILRVIDETAVAIRCGLLNGIVPIIEKSQTAIGHRHRLAGLLIVPDRTEFPTAPLSSYFGPVTEAAAS